MRSSIFINSSCVHQRGTSTGCGSPSKGPKIAALPSGKMPCRMIGAETRFSHGLSSSG